MAQNKIVIAILGVVSIIGVIAAVSLGMGFAALSGENQHLIQERERMVNVIQTNEDALILLDDWYKEDGYTDATQWWNDYTGYRSFLCNARERVESTENSSFATEEQLNRLSEIEKETKEARSVKKLKQLRDEFDAIIQTIADQRTAAEKIVVEASYNESYGENSYSTPSGGLTKQSGVNYHDGRTETYYSSNVLYHYRTNEWSTDDEGFYRTNDGYYVVAASDMSEGTVFETSKGTAIVLDSGCSDGVTDFYVAW